MVGEHDQNNIVSQIFCLDLVWWPCSVPLAGKHPTWAWKWGILQFRVQGLHLLSLTCNGSSSCCDLMNSRSLFSVLRDVHLNFLLTAQHIICSWTSANICLTGFQATCLAHTSSVWFSLPSKPLPDWRRPPPPAHAVPLPLPFICIKNVIIALCWWPATSRLSFLIALAASCKWGHSYISCSPPKSISDFLKTG